ncbi:MAG: discoidin domain-containing protein [Tannerella sp.]|jgi:hypothetical protein|nr:discoidin domain-containing protein [Tannerella sp.]
MKKNMLYALILGLFVSCAQPSRLEQVLALAGENQAELLNVLEHYRRNPSDSLKYKAACFLIENMSGRYSEDDRPAEAYHDLFRQWLQLSKGGRILVGKEVSDSLLRVFHLNTPHRKRFDMHNITASYLINNIEQAFKVRTAMPWGKDVPFDVFCEEILPYRLGREPLENWRDRILEQYHSLYDSLRNSNADALTASIRIFDAMGTAWDEVNNFSDALPDMNYSMIHALRIGTCVERVKYGLYVMRALGVPVTLDFTPQWPFRSMGHTWCSVRDGNGRYIPFIPTESKPGEPHKPDHKMAKAYRHTYEANRHSLAFAAKDQHVPMFFRNPYMQDISSLTFSAADIAIAPEQLHEKQNLFYLAVFDDQNWVPIHWAAAGNPIVFTDMGKEIVYLPVCVQKDSLKACGFPFIFTGDEKIQWLNADTARKQTLTLTRKHPLLSDWGRRMTGGEFQAANQSDFSDAVTLYRVTDVPDGYREIALNKPDAFRYYRFYSPNEWAGNVAELEFYTGSDHRRVSGKIIGTPGSYEGLPRTLDKAFDGDVLTFFDPPTPDSAWVGMDFETKIVLSGIRYLPRNDDNNIAPGQLYELFYRGRDGWVSLGKQTATDYVLHYDRAPVHALFLLRNLSKGKEERPFTYENGKQVWW